MPTAKIMSAVLAPSRDLAPHLPGTIDVGTESVSLSLAHVDDISPNGREALYALFNRNMAPVAAGTSMAHDELSKREELFDPVTRYLLLLRSSSPSPSSDTVPMPGALPRSNRKGKSKATIDFKEDDLVGYCSFRFDTEETLGDQDVEVIYCYELQLGELARGKGLGKTLMDELERIGAARGMAKSMLTCLKANTSAVRFYTKQGYQPDEIDPTRMAEEESEDEDEEWQEVGSDGEPLDKEGDEVDYLILSKNLQLQQ